ncbi:MAG TPA: hypothetical protein VKW08_08150 [Xanthobacteraceae bacterium]|nr:hypothetical protein [Xanthobacteraceae bacterium]
MTLGIFRRDLREGIVGASRPTAGGLLLFQLLLLIVLMCAAVTYIVYVLWPRWPGTPVPLDAPELPITVGGVAFNVPPTAVRISVQRRGGAHERIDLAFLWPSLKPADAAPKPAAVETLPAQGAAAMLDRIFVTISSAGDSMAPEERVQTIYPRYAEADPVSGPEGLAVLAFRPESPYQGEDLIYDAAAPESFLVRCTRNGAGATPGICLYERRIDGAADVVARFPRDWLEDWQAVAANINRLIEGLRPAAAAR